jgi:hypothetical protein
MVALTAFLAGLGAVAVAARGGSGATPAAKPLANAVHDSLAGATPRGVTARITFTNNLLPTGALSGQVGSALMSGASGRLWTTNDGRGRLELQSDAGDAQIVWSKTLVTIFDASSNTVYRLKVPQHSSTSSKHDQAAVPAVAQIQKFLNELGAHVAVSGAAPDNVGGQPAYSVRLSPKQHGGLLGGVEAAWDAARPVPLRLGIYPKGATSPVLELRVTDVSYGAVPSSDVDVAPPASAHVVDLSGVATHAGSGTEGHSKAVTGYDAVRNAAAFPVNAPATLAGRARADIRLIGKGDSQTVVATYGEGLDSIVAVERKASGQSRLPGGLPEVTVGNAKAHELTTPLGTVLAWNSGGVSFVVAGSVEPSTAEAAARGLG